MTLFKLNYLFKELIFNSVMLGVTAATYGFGGTYFTGKPASLSLFSFLQLYLQHTEVPRLGLKLELQLQI